MVRGAAVRRACVGRAHRACDACDACVRRCGCQSLFGFGPSATVAITFDAPPAGAIEDDTTKKTEASGGAGGAGAGTSSALVRPTRRVETMDGSAMEDLVIIGGAEHVKGRCKVTVPAGKKLEHTGVKLELVGNIGASIVRPFVRGWSLAVRPVTLRLCVLVMCVLIQCRAVLRPG